MAIEDVDDWWYADGPEDLDEYLNVFGSRFPLNEIRHGVCVGCGGNVFGMHGDVDARNVEWTCRGCGQAELLPGCDRSWLPGEPTLCRCDCMGLDFNVAVGYALRPSGEVYYFCVAERCTSCGLLGTFVDRRYRESQPGFRLP